MQLWEACESSASFKVLFTSFRYSLKQGEGGFFLDEKILFLHGGKILYT